jgi:hypothetical protein
MTTQGLVMWKDIMVEENTVNNQNETTVRLVMRTCTRSYTLYRELGSL